MSTHFSPFSGTWYPQDSTELNDLLARLFADSAERAGPCLLPGAIGFVVPHAALGYSGTVAASVYRHLRAQEPSRIVLLGLSHRHDFTGVKIPDIAGYETSRGATLLDDQAITQL